MQQSLFILGRQPALGRAELERLYGADVVEPVGTHAMLGSLSPAEVSFERLGGSVKLCSVLEILDTTNWRDLQTAVITAGVKLGQEISEGKIQLGLSAYDLRISTRQLTAGGLELKKALRQAGRSVRLVQNQELSLNSAQILHNHLTGERGIELVLVKHGAKTILARTIAEQDIESYTERDRGRPKRDAFVGMLPPKLAQILVNLAVGDANPLHGPVILDPFCGTGVVLQEASLMGFDIYGSDLEPRMVDYTDKNLQWLLTLPENKVTPLSPDNHYYKLEVGDATTHTWTPAPSFVASETYLGHPFTTPPTAEKLASVRQTCNLILEKFLKNIGEQLKPGTTLCLAVPAWQQKPGTFVHLPLLDRLSILGYNRIDLKYVRASELLYYRPDQVVARELLIITRK